MNPCRFLARAAGITGLVATTTLGAATRVAHAVPSRAPSPSPSPSP